METEVQSSPVPTEQSAPENPVTAGTEKASPAITPGPKGGRLPVLALLLALTFGGLMLADLIKTSRQNRTITTAARFAEKELNEAADPKAGWFPYPHDPIYSWDDDPQGWFMEDDAPEMAYNNAPEPFAGAPADTPARPQKQSLRIMATNETPPRRALAVPVHFPDPGTVMRSNRDPSDKHKMVGVRMIAYDVFVPKECHGFVGCLFFMKDKDGVWYQARSRGALLAGQWNTVTADLRGDSPDVEPLEHLGQWSENQATQIQFVGITFYGDKEFKGDVLLSNFRGWMRSQRFKQVVNELNGLAPNSVPIAVERVKSFDDLKKAAVEYKDPPLQIINFRTDPAAPPGLHSSPPIVRKFETFTLRFELNRDVDNPFDPEKADIACTVETPGGEKLEHYGFWFQDYDRTDNFAGDELRPMGRPEWRVRITPREAGEYHYRLHAKVRDGQDAQGNPHFTAVDGPTQSFSAIPSGLQGFVRVSHSDPRYFEFENNEFYYPIGFNLHSPVDTRCWSVIFHQTPPAGRGTNMYKDYFTKMEQAGENVAEVWMSSWWLGIEWTSNWKDYYGKGRYSLQHAWKMDYVLELAREHNMHCHITIDNHGKFSNWVDQEWELNPFNVTQPGGFLNSASDYFDNPLAQKMHRNRLRYVAARWGPSPQILGWELISEYDLTGQDSRHRTPEAQAWAEDMIGFLRKADVYKHPVTNHYSGDYGNVDMVLGRIFDYVVCDAYRQERNYSGMARRLQSWMSIPEVFPNGRKPVWVTEYGGYWNATPPPALNSDVQAGLWATWMSEGGATPLFWWYDFIDKNNLYTYYHGFSNYVKGEDKRGINGTMEQLPQLAGPGGLGGTAYRWKTGAYGWMYSEQSMRMMPPREEWPKFTGAESAIPELQEGKYRVEYWDINEGKILRSEEKTITAGEALRLKFPEFINACAIKVKALGK